MFLQHNTSQIVGKAAEKLITSYQLILHKDSSWSSRTRKYHLNKGITSQIKREWKTREDIPFWALHKNAFLLRGAKRLITTTKGAMMKGQGCPLQIPFSTSFCPEAQESCQAQAERCCRGSDCLMCCCCLSNRPLSSSFALGLPGMTQIPRFWVTSPTTRQNNLPFTVMTVGEAHQKDSHSCLPPFHPWLSFTAGPVYLRWPSMQKALLLWCTIRDQARLWLCT